MRLDLLHVPWVCKWWLDLRSQLLGFLNGYYACNKSQAMPPATQAMLFNINPFSSRKGGFYYERLKIWWNLIIIALIIRTVHLKEVIACAVLSRFSCVQLFATLWSVAHWVPLSMGILQARISEWVAVPSFRGSSWPRDGTCGSYDSWVGRWVLYH